MTKTQIVGALDGRNRAIVIAESLARVIAAIRIASVRWRSYPPPRNTEISPHRPSVSCVAIRIARLAFIRLTFVPRGTAEWPARVDRVRRFAEIISLLPVLTARLLETRVGRARTGRGTGEAGRGPGEERARPGEEGCVQGFERTKENARIWRDMKA